MSQPKESSLCTPSGSISIKRELLRDAIHVIRCPLETCPACTEISERYAPNGVYKVLEWVCEESSALSEKRDNSIESYDPEIGGWKVTGRESPSAILPNDSTSIPSQRLASSEARPGTTPDEPVNGETHQRRVAPRSGSGEGVSQADGGERPAHPSYISPDKRKPRLVTPEELAAAPKTQALMVELIDRPEKAAEKVKGEVPQLQAGITALFEALSECGIHAARLERELATAKRQACTSEHRATCSFASSAIAPMFEEVPVAWLIVHCHGPSGGSGFVKEVVLSPLTDEHHMDEGDEAWPLYKKISRADGESHG